MLRLLQDMMLDQLLSLCQIQNCSNINGIDLEPSELPLFCIPVLKVVRPEHIASQKTGKASFKQSKGGKPIKDRPEELSNAGTLSL